MSLGDIIGKPNRKKRTKARSAPYKKNKGGGGRARGNSDGRRVYVGNLSYGTEWQDLKDIMREAGDVEFVDIFKGADGRSKGCAIVEYSTVKGAKDAIETLYDRDIDGRPIFVRFDKEPHRNDKVGGTGGGNGRGIRFDEPVFSPNSNMAMKIRNNAKPNTCVFVGNLPWSAEWQEVKDICAKFGKVERADVEQEDGGRSKGCAVVVFSNAQGAKKCINQLNGATYEDRELEVRLDRTTSYNRRGGAGGGGGGGRGGGGGPRIALRGGQGKFAGRLTSGGGSSGGGGGRRGPKVFVGNLPWSVTWQDLKDLCKQYGAVGYADVPQNDEGKSKGFGLVRYESPGGARKCINELNGMLLDGRELEVRMDRE